MTFSGLATYDVPAPLKTAEPWSLFNPRIRDAHYGALSQMLPSADKSP